LQEHENPLIVTELGVVAATPAALSAGVAVVGPLTPNSVTIRKLAVASVPEGVYPVADLEFPSKGGTGPPVKLKVVLNGRLC
jgi:hypothetical protein